MLQKARGVLVRVRNRSRALSPIGMLPSEILIIRSSARPKAPAWASVCAEWRQLYLRFHATSSHLDLVVGGGAENIYYRHAEATANRSPGSPLHLVIRNRVDNTVNSVVSPDEIARLVGFITPLMPRVCALEISFENGSQLLLDSVVLCWIDGRPRDPPKVFKVWNSFTSKAIQLASPAKLSSQGPLSSRDFWEFFRPLQTLALQHCYVSPTSGILGGLVDLHLDWPYGNQAPLNILEILAASPGLRSLTIDDVECVQREDTPEAVYLNALQNLTLSQCEIKNSLNRFLPWLNTGANLVSAMMRVIIHPDFIPESQDFFRRSSVKRLFAYGTERYRCTLVAQLCPAPDLEELVLRECNLKVAST
ncbi:hypothetical protein FRC06_010932, partial [Ceratobasidium sp. 370]